MFPDGGRVPHISLVFREMWDTTDVDRSVYRVNLQLEGRSRGIPHLAKNERDVGHPAFVREQEAHHSCGFKTANAIQIGILASAGQTAET